MKALEFVRESQENRLLLQQQLVKDFGSIGELFSEKFQTDVLEWNTLVASVRELTLNIIEKGEQKLLQLLYQVDIQEQYFLNLLGHESFLNKLTEAVIKREAEKIYFRKKYS